MTRESALAKLLSDAKAEIGNIRSKIKAKSNRQMTPIELETLFTEALKDLEEEFGANLKVEGLQIVDGKVIVAVCMGADGKPH